MPESIRLSTECLSISRKTTSWKSLNHRFFFADLTKVDQLCHENVIAHRAREAGLPVIEPEIVTHNFLRHRSSLNGEQNGMTVLYQRQLLQLGVLRLGLLQDEDIGISVFPECKKILVGGSCLAPIPRECVGSAQLQVRQCADGIAEHDPSVVDNFLEFPGGFRPLMCGQIGPATDIGRVE